MDELTRTQKRIALKLRCLTQEVRQIHAEWKETNSQLVGLADSFDYTLQNEAYKALPKLLQQDFRLALKQRLDREYIRDNQGKEIEVNILGKAECDNKEFLIVGESKSQLSRNDINNFIRKKLKRLQGVHENLFPLLTTHQVSASDVAEYAKEKGIALYKSSQF